MKNTQFTFDTLVALGSLDAIEPVRTALADQKAKREAVDAAETALEQARVDSNTAPDGVARRRARRSLEEHRDSSLDTRARGRTQSARFRSRFERRSTP